MVAKIQKWGNSQGLRINSQVLKDAHISIGDEVELTVHEGFIAISPKRRRRGKYNLEQLVSRIPKDYQVEELNWGEPLGNEVW